MGERVVEFSNGTAFEGTMDFGSTHSQAVSKIAIPPLAILPKMGFDENWDVLRFEHRKTEMIVLTYILHSQIENKRSRSIIEIMNFLKLPNQKFQDNDRH
jgi:hypothetical protein